jgi:hypothetical protein
MPIHLDAVNEKTSPVVETTQTQINQDIPENWNPITHHTHLQIYPSRYFMHLYHYYSCYFKWFKIFVNYGSRPVQECVRALHQETNPYMNSNAVHEGADLSEFPNTRQHQTQVDTEINDCQYLRPVDFSSGFITRKNGNNSLFDLLYDIDMRIDVLSMKSFKLSSHTLNQSELRSLHRLDRLFSDLRNVTILGTSTISEKFIKLNLNMESFEGIDVYIDKVQRLVINSRKNRYGTLNFKEYKSGADGLLDLSFERRNELMATSVEWCTFIPEMQKYLNIAETEWKRQLTKGSYMYDILLADTVSIKYFIDKYAAFLVEMPRDLLDVLKFRFARHVRHMRDYLGVHSYL